MSSRKTPRCHLKSPWYLLQSSRDPWNLRCVTLEGSKPWPSGSEGECTKAPVLAPWQSELLPLPCFCGIHGAVRTGAELSPVFPAPWGGAPHLSPLWIPITCQGSGGACSPGQSVTMLGNPGPGVRHLGSNPASVPIKSVWPWETPLHLHLPSEKPSLKSCCEDLPTLLGTRQVLSKHQLLLVTRGGCGTDLGAMSEEWALHSAPARREALSGLSLGSRDEIPWQMQL